MKRISKRSGRKCRNLQDHSDWPIAPASPLRDLNLHRPGECSRLFTNSRSQKELSVIVEALKMDSLQRLCSSLEPILRRVVSEEVERALARLAPANLAVRSSPQRVGGPDGKNLRLQFRSRLSHAVFTGGKVEGEQGAAIHVVLLDANSGQVITTGPESLAKLDVVVLEGDFNNDEEEDWTQEDFRNHEVREREGKRPLLTGDLQVTLKEGVGTLGDLIFTDNSSWIRSRKFRLGVKVAAGYCEGIRIREASTEAFTVKDHRGELYKKHYPPALHDEVWRLDKIGKDGAFHKKLNKVGIQTVEDFLRLVVRDPQKLRNILGSGMSNKMWESTVEHAKTCVLSGKLYVYYVDQTQSVGVIFNHIYEFRGLVANGQYGPAESLSDSEKVFVDALLKKAYDNWTNVVEYDGEDLVSLRSNKRGIGSMPIVQSATAFNEPASVTHGSVATPLEQGGLAGSVCKEKSATRYIDQSKEVITNNPSQFGNMSFGDLRQVGLAGSSQQNTVLRTDAMVGLALGPSNAAISTNVPYHSIGSVIRPGNMNVPSDWSCLRDNQGTDGYTQGSGVDDYFSIDDIRSRSFQMLENDDMQQLLRMFSVGTAGASAPDESHDTYSAFTPSPNYKFSESRGRTSGKAVVGWLKLKAALRWGIFIRKIAAERRARLEELE